MSSIQSDVRPTSDHVPPRTWDDFTAMIKGVAEREGEWAGIPVPAQTQPLVLEPSHPFRHLDGLSFANMEARERRQRSPIEMIPIEDDKTINSWKNGLSGSTIYVVRRRTDGKAYHFKMPTKMGRLDMLINTMGAVLEVFDEKIERAAHEKLRSLLTPHAYGVYFMTGMFLEASPRSGVTYLFRRLRPTIALSANKHGVMKVLACLCLHPIGYYADTWAGCLCPTDDVVAHLMLMRGDEHYFWRKANHHCQLDNEAGI